MRVRIEVDARNALARFSPEGIPQAVRRNLAAVLPDLTRRLGAAADRNLDTGLQSRNRITLKKEIVENDRGITGRVTAVWTGDRAKAFIPQVLESGARAHPIAARRAAVLAFFWPRIGRMAFFREVWHPGFPGIWYMQNAFRSMEDEIFESIDRAVRGGLGVGARR